MQQQPLCIISSTSTSSTNATNNKNNTNTNNPPNPPNSKRRTAFKNKDKNARVLTCCIGTPGWSAGETQSVAPTDLAEPKR